jgi:hypothetical protein
VNNAAHRVAGDDGARSRCCRQKLNRRGRGQGDGGGAPDEEPVSQAELGGLLVHDERRPDGAGGHPDRDRDVATGG